MLSQMRVEAGEAGKLLQLTGRGKARLPPGGPQPGNSLRRSGCFGNAVSVAAADLRKGGEGPLAAFAEIDDGRRVGCGR